MALRKIGGIGGPVFKWDQIGKSIKGFLLKIADGKQFAGNTEKSKLATFATVEGPVVVCGAPKALAGRLSEVLVGTYVEIIYLGQERGQAGVLYKSFDVQADDERRISPADVAAALAKPRTAAPQNALAPVQPALVANPFVPQASAPFVQPAASAPPSVQGGIDLVAALEQKLRDAKGTQIGDLMVNALKTRHAADPVAYLGALGDTLKASGVAV